MFAIETVFFPLHAAVDDHHQETLTDISRHYLQQQRDAGICLRECARLSLGPTLDWLHARALTRGKRDEGATPMF